MMKLSAYVKRTVLMTMLASVVGLWLLQLLFVYLSELERLNESYDFLAALRFVGYRAAHYLVLFMPTGVLLGAVIGLGVLAKNSELVVMRAAGISLYQIIGWVLQPALLFVLVALMANQWLVPVAQHHARQIKDPDSSVFRIQGYRIVMTDEYAPQKKQIIFIDQADSQGRLDNIKRFELNDGKLGGVLMAPTGHYIGTSHLYEWQVNQVQMMTLDDGRALQQTKPTNKLNLPIAQDSIYLLTRPPMDMSISALYQHHQLMTHQQTYSPQHRLAFWQKLLSPFAVLSLVLVACSFVFGSLRSQSLGLRVVVALLVGLLFSYLQDLAGFVALALNLPPVLMVLLPIVASATIGLWLIAKKH